MDQLRSHIAGKFRVILILMVIVLIGMGSTTLFSRPVTLNYDGELRVVNTTAATVELFLKEEEIEPYKNIFVEPALDTMITEGMTITYRSPKKITILDDGKETVVESPYITVEDILKDKKIVLGGNDFVIPTAKTELNFKDGTPMIIINRVFDKETSQVLEMPFETEIIENAELEKGKKNVIQKGIKGSKLVTTTIKVKNGVETQEVKTEEKILEEPVKEIVEIGTKKVKREESFTPLQAGQTLMVEATAYTGDPSENGGWTKTSMGTELRHGVIAVDPNVIPLGTNVYVEGYGYARAEDTGSSIKGNKIDLLMETKDESMNWGRRKVKVHILGD